MQDVAGEECMACLTNMSLVLCANSASVIYVKHLKLPAWGRTRSSPWAGARRDKPETEEDFHVMTDDAINEVTVFFKSMMVRLELMRMEDPLQMFFHPMMFGVVKRLVNREYTGEIKDREWIGSEDEGKVWQHDDSACHVQHACRRAFGRWRQRQ